MVGGDRQRLRPSGGYVGDQGRSQTLLGADRRFRRVEEKIGEKVQTKDGSPTKFPAPNGAIHLILVDMRGYIDGGSHKNPYRQIAYGAGDPEVNKEWVPESWQGLSGKRAPIKGMFEVGNPLPASQLVQEHIHFLGFINEREYRHEGM
jgi:hypothetical protein